MKAKVEEIKLSGDSYKIATEGRFVKIVKLRSEYYVSLPRPDELMAELRQRKTKGHLFTFVQEIGDEVPRHRFHQEFDQIAVLPVTTYENWFEKQLYFKPRNKLRKGQKSGIEVRVLEFDDNLVRLIKEVYDENPVRQGTANVHYQKDLDTIKVEHSAFLDRSLFIGVFLKGEIIGFSKATICGNSAIIMNIMAKVSHRDKAPTNVLVAKWVEICAGKGLRNLVYGVWGGGGLREFKVANGFQCLQVPRYYVPLTVTGRLMLRLGLHRNLKDRLPRKLIDFAVKIRSGWTAFKFKFRKRESENQRKPLEAVT